MGAIVGGAKEKRRRTRTHTTSIPSCSKKFVLHETRTLHERRQRYTRRQRPVASGGGATTAAAAAAAAAAGAAAGSGCTRARDERGRQYVHTVRARADMRVRFESESAHCVACGRCLQPTADWPDQASLRKAEEPRWKDDQRPSVPSLSESMLPAGRRNCAANSCCCHRCCRC